MRAVFGASLLDAATVTGKVFFRIPAPQLALLPQLRTTERLFILVGCMQGLPPTPKAELIAGCVSCAMLDRGPRWAARWSRARAALQAAKRAFLAASEAATLLSEGSIFGSDRDSGAFRVTAKVTGRADLGKGSTKKTNTLGAAVAAGIEEHHSSLRMMADLNDYELDVHAQLHAPPQVR